MNETIISQFANSPTILAIVDTFDQAISTDSIFDNFYDFVLNIETAEGFGLDIWGRIVGVTRNNLVDVYNNPVTITDDQYRSVILCKALANISRSSIVDMNAVLNFLFASSGGAYVQDGLDMTLTYVFLFIPNLFQLGAIKYIAKVLRPTGVGAFILTQSSRVFGFQQLRSSTTDVRIGNFSSANGAPFLPHFALGG